MTVFHSVTTQEHYDIWGVLGHLEADSEGDYTWLQQISTAIQERGRNFATNQKPIIRTTESSSKTDVKFIQR